MTSASSLPRASLANRSPSAPPMRSRESSPVKTHSPSALLYPSPRRLAPDTNRPRSACFSVSVFGAGAGSSCPSVVPTLGCSGSLPPAIDLSGLAPAGSSACSPAGSPRSRASRSAASVEIRGELKGFSPSFGIEEYYLYPTPKRTLYQVVNPHLRGPFVLPWRVVCSSPGVLNKRERRWMAWNPPKNRLCGGGNA